MALFQRFSLLFLVQITQKHKLQNRFKSILDAAQANVLGRPKHDDGHVQMNRIRKNACSSDF